ncbi:MAG: glycosyl transferase, partial [Candidatus Gygaella obscura]|nr:glycosyl transferase [Candidatus Gygaella obscura]
QIKTFFDIMELDNADVVIGSKRHPNSVLNYPWHRRLVSSIYFFLVKILFGLPIRDTQTGLKLFKYEVLAKAFPRVLVKKFAFDLELLVNIHHLGYTIAEAPVRVDSKRKFGRIGVNSIMHTFWDTLAIWYRMYILKYYD